MQETCKIRWLMYCKSTICKSGQFKFDSVINWKPVHLIRPHAVLRALPTAMLRPPALSTTPRQPGHAAPSSCRIRQMLTLCPCLQRFVPPRSATRHCRGGSHTIIHRRPGSNQAWLSVRTTQRYGRTSVSRQLASLSRRHCNALCSTVSIALPTRESRLVWPSSSVPTGGKVSERTLPDGQSRVKLVKKLRCTNTPMHRSSDCRHRPSDSVIHVDLVGPSNPACEGKNTLLTVIDRWTGWPEAFPMTMHGDAANTKAPIQALQALVPTSPSPYSGYSSYPVVFTVVLTYL